MSTRESSNLVGYPPIAQSLQLPLLRANIPMGEANHVEGGNVSSLDQVVARARQEREHRELGYREQALRLYPWVCGRCGREFDRGNLQELTVHHRDHDHDNNPADGSNWELLCLYCHDNEHARQLENTWNSDQSGDVSDRKPVTYKPFAELGALLGKR